MRSRIAFVSAVAVAAWVIASSPARAQGVAKNARSGAPAERAPKASAAPPAADPRELQQRMDQLLKLWEQQSTRLQSLDVSIHRIDRSPKWAEGEFEEYYGRAILKSPNLAWLNLEMVVKNSKNQKVREPYEQIRCTGSEVWLYQSKTRQIYIYPLEKDERQRALDEGPLPFLFNMRAAEAKGRYRMQLLSEDEKSYVIGVLPLKQVDKEAFRQAYLQLDRKYLLPTQIVLVAPDGRDTKEYILSAIKPNAPVADDNFQGKMLRGWTVERAEPPNKPRQAGQRGVILPRRR